jgi:hypothetical protein
MDSIYFSEMYAMIHLSQTYNLSKELVFLIDKQICVTIAGRRTKKIKLVCTDCFTNIKAEKIIYSNSIVEGGLEVTS